MGGDQAWSDSGEPKWGSERGSAFFCSRSMQAFYSYTSRSSVHCDKLCYFSLAAIRIVNPLRKASGALRCRREIKVSYRTALAIQLTGECCPERHPCSSPAQTSSLA